MTYPPQNSEGYPRLSRGAYFSVGLLLGLVLVPILQELFR